MKSNVYDKMNETQALIPHEVKIQVCQNCGRVYNSKSWKIAPLDSLQFLNICIENLQLIPEIEIERAEFITEPNSTTFSFYIFLKFIYQGVLQSKIIHFIINEVDCGECLLPLFENPEISRWDASVIISSLNGRLDPQLWLKQKILIYTLAPSGYSFEDNAMNLYFPSKVAAFHFISYIKSILPIKIEEKLNTIYRQIEGAKIPDIHVQYNLTLPLVWINDLVIYNNSIFLCISIGSSFSFLNPITGSIIMIDSELYWENPFQPFLTISDTKVYKITNINSLRLSSGRIKYAEVILMDSKNVSLRVNCFITNSLHCCDECLAYDLTTIDFPSGFTGSVPNKIIVGRNINSNRSKNSI